MPTKPLCRRESAFYGYDPKDVIDTGRQGVPGKKGDPGRKGDPGFSAYQLALRNGFVGTEEEWLESLHGEPGDGAVDSVNGQTGDVVLGAADVGADPLGSGIAAAAASMATHISNTDPHPQYNVTKVDGGFF